MLWRISLDEARLEECSSLIRRKNTSLCVSSYTLFVWLHVHSSTAIRHWGMFPGLPLSVNQSPNQNNINVRQSSSTRHFIRTCKLSDVPSVFHLLALSSSSFITEYGKPLISCWWTEHMYLQVDKVLVLIQWHYGLIEPFYSYLYCWKINWGPMGYSIALENPKLKWITNT
jgi:hypothetical protein